MIDIHCHILPGIDDGSGSLEESVAMARVLAENGFTGVIATPHVMDKDGYRQNRETVKAAVLALAEALAREGVPLKVYAGAEYYLDRSVPDLARLLHPLSTAAEGHYILVELPVMSIPPYLDYSVFPSPQDPPELHKVLPYLRPIIAHPERNQQILSDYRRVGQLRRLGYLCQVNMESILGLAGKLPQKVIKKMAKAGFIDFVGTDGHSSEALRDMLPGWRKTAEKIMGRDVAAQVLDRNSMALINNESIETEE